MNLQLEGKVAIITGAGRGSGRVFALAFARERATVVATDVDGDAAERTAAGIRANGGQAFGFRMDVSRWDEVAPVVEEVIRQAGRIDILVNNAGWRLPATVEEITDELWDRHLDVNLRGVFYTIRAVLPHMKQQRYGRIVNISSLSGRRGHPFRGAAYAAAKAGVHGLTKSVAHEVSEFGITVNAVAPSTVNTEFIASLTEAERTNLASRSAVGRNAESEDLVGIVLLLSSDAGGYIDGQVVTVDGGQTMM